MNIKLRNSVNIKNAWLLKDKNQLITDELLTVDQFPSYDNSSVDVEHLSITISNKISALRTKRFLKKLLKPIWQLIKICLKPILIRFKSYLINDINHCLITQSQKIEEFQSHLITQSQKIEEFQSHLITQSQKIEEFQSHLITQSQKIEEFQSHLITQSQKIEEFQSHLFSVKQIDLISDLNNRLQSQENFLVPKLNRIEEYAFATARRIAIPCGLGEILIKSAVGFILCSKEDHALIACLLDTGDLEVGTRLLIQKFLKSGDTFVDIGANIGIHTLAAARAMQGKGKIIAIEPFENTAKMLRKSVWLNGFSDIVEIHQVAISTDAGTHSLYLGDTSGHHSLLPLVNVINLAQPSVDVPLARLDNLLSHKQSIDLLKIDVEGAEVDVIQSGISLIEENPEIAIIVEFAPLHLKRAGKSLDDWMDTFIRLGLCYQVIDEYTGALKECSRNELMEAYSLNLFFAKPNSSAWGRTRK
jgi:FkbM family methyltransferase